MTINAEFTVVLRNGKPFIKWEQASETTYMKVYGAKTDKPYVKYNSAYTGKTYLTDIMKEQLKEFCY